MRIRSVGQSADDVPAEWHEDMRKNWEREKLRADMLANALHDAYEKIIAYHEACNGAYQGGVPNQVLLPQIRLLLGIKK